MSEQLRVRIVSSREETALSKSKREEIKKRLQINDPE